jgi:hypothetical protein
VPAEQEPPALPVSDPGRPSFDDVLQAGSDRRLFSWREHRLLTGSLLAAVLVGGAATALLHARAAERAAQRASEVQLTARSEGYGSEGVAEHPDQRRYSLSVRLTEARHRPFRIVSLSLPDLGATPDFLPSLAEPSSRATLRVDTDCARVSRLPPELVVLTTVQRPGQRHRSVRLPLDGSSSFAESLQRDCGYGGVAESVLFGSRTPPSVHGPAATVDVEVQNGSRRPAQLVDVTFPDARVTTSPALPLELPPFAAGRPGAPVWLRLTITYLRCPALIEGQGNEPALTLTLVDRNGSRQSASTSFGDWDDALRPLYSQSCP